LSYIRSLEDVLKEKDVALFNRLAEVKRQSIGILQYANAKFPYYTPHGFPHSQSVLENLNWLLSEDVKTELNAHELFFLIVASWLHDWGLVGEQDEKPEVIRENHHIRTEDKFEKFHALVGVSLNEGRIIGRICRGHRQENLYDEKYDDTPFETGVVIHRRFLASALRIADEIDVTYSRVPEIVFYNLDPSEKAEEEFKKQMNIVGVAYPSEKERHKLILSAIAWDPNGVRALEMLRDKIQGELNHVKGILATGVNGRGLSLDYVELKVDTKGFMKEPIEFELDRRKILDLLIGKSLYSRHDVAIRELVQNAIDACRLKKSLEGEYDAEIVISEGDGKIVVEDNGVGMDFTTARKYLSVVGSSFYSSEEFKKLSSEGKGFDPISRWGLGFLSTFLISSGVVIETKKTDNQPCRFLISKVDGGWRYERGSLQKPGTKVTLLLNEEGQKIDLEKTLHYYIRIPEIPIFLTKNGKKEKFVPQSGMDMVKELYREPTIAKDLEKHAQPEIAWECQIENDAFDISFLGLEWPGSLSVHLLECFASIHGIRIRLPQMSMIFQSDLAVFLNIKKNVVDYEVSRECVIDNERLRSLETDIFAKFLEWVVQDFKEKSWKKEMTPLECEIAFEKFTYSRIGYYFLKESTMREYVHKRLVGKLSKKGWSLEQIESIISEKPKRLLVFPAGLGFTSCQKLEKRLLLMKSLVGANLGNTDIAIFTFGWYGDAKLFGSLLREEGIEVISPNLGEYVARSSRIVSTPIDSILPPGVRFAEIPEGYWEDIVEVRPPTDNPKADSPTRMFWQNEALEYAFIMEDMPEVIEGFLLPGVYRSVVAKIARGEYLVNIKNKVVGLLLNNAERVLTEPLLLEAAKIYVRASLARAGPDGILARVSERTIRLILESKQLPA